jgi:hypothetical protein
MSHSTFMNGRSAQTPPPETGLLHRIEESARRCVDLRAELGAEKERRDRLMAEAEQLGHSYRAIAAAARQGDGQATVSVVRNAVFDVASGRYDQKDRTLTPGPSTPRAAPRPPSSRTA